jgi:hypothetical protein
MPTQQVKELSLPASGSPERPKFHYQYTTSPVVYASGETYWAVRKDCWRLEDGKWIFDHYTGKLYRPDGSPA